MKKVFYFVMYFILVCLNLYSQGLDSENAISINEVTYYYKPSKSPSSPIPKMDGSASIVIGNWYGENAAKAWAAMIDWVIEHCTESNAPVIPKQGEKVYITSLHSYKGNTPESRKYAIGATMDSGFPSRDGITIYYWIVPKDQPMENGFKMYRSFAFSNW